MLDTPRGELSDTHAARFPDMREDPKGRGAKKDKKARKRAEMARRLAALGTDLAGLDIALRKLGNRLGDLHGVQLAQEEGMAASAAKIAALTERLDGEAARAAAAREREAELRGAVAEVKSAVDALRAEAGVITESLADIAAQPDRDTALFVLEDRVEAAEELIGAMQASLTAAQPDPQIGVELRQALSELKSLRLQVSQGLREQGERLSVLEQRLDDEVQAVKAAIPVDDRWEDAYRALRADLDQRLDTVVRDIEAVNAEARAERSGVQVWTEHRVHALGRKLGTGFAILGLLVFGLFAASWWRTDQRFEAVSAHIGDGERTKAEALGIAPVSPGDTIGPESALGRLTATLQSVQARNDRLEERLIALREADASAPLDAVRTRLKHVEQTQADLTRSAEESARLAATLTARLESITRAEPSDAIPGSVPSERQEQAAQAPLAADAGRDRDVTLEAAGPGDTAGKADPEVLTERRYAIQLIGFRSMASIAPFARTFGVASEARYMLSKYRGRDWYVVLIGNFASSVDGITALERLPEELRGLKPWVRPLRPGTRLFSVD